MARPGVVASFAFKKNHLRELKEVFEAADKNGDGKLSVEELYDQLKLAGLDVSMDEVKQIIAEKDKDFDGYLSFEEFAGQETRIEMAFKAIDVNNDGYISKQEFQQVCRDCSVEQINAAFKKFDKSGNGLLDYREFCKMMNDHKKQRELETPIPSSSSSKLPNFDSSFPPSAVKYEVKKKSQK